MLICWFFWHLKLDDTKSDHMKTFNLLRHENIIYHIKYTVFILWTTILWYHQMANHKTTWKNSHASQSTKYLSFINIEVDTLLQLQNVEMPPFLPSVNPYQQTIYDLNKNPLKQYTGKSSKTSHSKIKLSIILKST